MSTYLKRPLYIMLTDEEARVIASVIADVSKVVPVSLRYMDKPDYRSVIKMKRDGTNEHLYLYHIVVTDPKSRYTASYELVVSEKDGNFLRYRGMGPRIFTHFAMNIARDYNVNQSHIVAGFLRVLEEIKAGPTY